jgi:predicted RNA binding protein YcfA (HicA-like mRNA interferase family)
MRLDSTCRAREARTEIAIMKVRQVIRLLTEDGWVLARQKGSHRQFKHPSKPGLVTVAGKLSDDLAPGTLNSVLKQAGLRK